MKYIFQVLILIVHTASPFLHTKKKENPNQPKPLLVLKKIFVTFIFSVYVMDVVEAK